MMTRRHLLATGLTALGSAAVLPAAAQAQTAAGASPDLGLFRPGSVPVPGSLSTATAPLEIGRVALTVNDLVRVQTFYERVIGLERLGGSGEVALLGAGDRVLLELRADPLASRPSIREAGLYHTAFLLPSRAALGRWVRHVVETDAPIQGASDHLVSEAVYLADPEGNGIEVYVDRPRHTWLWQDGSIQMDTLPFDGEGVVEAADGPWTGAPDTTVVGHVHLQVGDIADAQASTRTRSVSMW